MVYLNKHIFKNILSYCDDRIEKKQKYYKNQIINQLELLQKNQLSIIYQNIIDDNVYGINNYDDYINNEELPTTIMNLLEYSTYNEDYEDDFNNELTDDFLEFFK